MCITTARATLSNTQLYVGEGRYNGEYVHVLAYSNKASALPRDWNSVAEPNAMVLPFPTSTEMTQKNMIDTTQFKSFLKDISKASKYVAKTLGYDDDRIAFNSRGLMKSAQVFSLGSYTVVLAEDVNQIPEALTRVPEKKRPKISDEFLAGYGNLYPNQPIAVCCWEGTIEAEPLLWWYKPTNKDTLFIPTMDAHDGGPPDVNASVRADHMISVGSDDNGRIGHHYQVRYTDRLTREVQQLLPSYVYGTKLKATVKNGDMFVDANKLGAGSKAYKDMPSATRAVSLASVNKGQEIRLEGWA
jgi:hypothetical protein